MLKAFVRHIKWILLAVVSMAPLLCHSSEAVCRHYGLADGLFNLQTRKIIEMPDGRILVQMEGMFNVFDGERFRNLEYDRTKTLSLSSFLNTDYYFVRNDVLWVKDNTHLFAIDVNTYAFLDVRQMLEPAKLKSAVTNLFIDNDGNAVIEADDHGLYVFDWKNPARKLMQITDKNSEGKVVQLADVLKVGDKYALFFSDGKFLCRTADGKSNIHSEQLIQQNKGHMLKALGWKENIIVFRDESGLMAYDLSTWKKTRLLDNVHVFDFKKTCKNRVNSYLHLYADSHVASENDAFRDSMYVSANNAVYIFDSNLQPVDTITSFIDERTGVVNSDNLQGVLIDRQDGIWVATFNNGIFFRPDVRNILHFRPLPQGKDAILQLFFPNNPRVRDLPVSITDIYTDRQHQTWLTTRNDGIIVLDSAGREFNWLKYSDVDGLWGAVPFIRQVDSNRYLICNRLNRLALLYRNERKLLNLTDKYQELMQFRNMVAIAKIEGGFIIGTQNGFFVLDARSSRLKPDIDRCRLLNENPYSDKCNCMLTDSDNIVWIGTQNGLLRFDEASQTIKRFSTNDGLPNNCVQSILKDKNGNIWMATMGGVCRMINKNGDIQFLSVPGQTDIDDYKFLERMAFAIGDSLFFATEKGILSLSPGDVILPEERLLPRLMSCLANDSTVVFSHDADNHVDIILNYDENYVNMDVSALNYAYPANTLYRYRINDSEDGWIIPEVHNGKISLSFSALEPGRYAIEVQAAMQGQEWGKSLNINLKLLPPWWRTWWAYTLYVVLFLAVVAAIAFLYVKSQRDKLAIEQKEARIRQLLEQIKVKSQIPENIEVEHNEEITVSKEDELFLQKAMECVETNMQDPDYGVEMFSRDMAMERSTLYRHLQAAIGKPPKEFIRTVRLKKAAELLRSGKYNVGEAADMVGFSNRKSFAKFFKEAFGVLPSKYN